MIRAQSDVRSYAAAGRTVVLDLGIPEAEKWILHEVRVPASSVQDTTVEIIINGLTRMILVPTINENVYTIEDEIQGSSSIEAVVTTVTATAQVVGVVIVYDDGK